MWLNIICTSDFWVVYTWAFYSLEDKATADFHTVILLSTPLKTVQHSGFQQNIQSNSDLKEIKMFMISPMKWSPWQAVTVRVKKPHLCEVTQLCGCYKLDNLIFFKIFFLLKLRWESKCNFGLKCITSDYHVSQTSSIFKFERQAVQGRSWGKQNGFRQVPNYLKYSLRARGFKGGY